MKPHRLQASEKTKNSSLVGSVWHLDENAKMRWWVAQTYHWGRAINILSQMLDTAHLALTSVSV